MNDPTKSGTPPSVEGIVSRPSAFSVEETVEGLKVAIHNRNLTLFAQIAHSDLARLVGLTMQEAHVLIFGNPKGGTPLMIASPLLAVDLPLEEKKGEHRHSSVGLAGLDAPLRSAAEYLPA